MAIPGDKGHLDAHNYWLQFIDDVVNKRIYPGPEGPTGPVGPEGPTGADGQGLKIDGFYDTFQEFIAAHPVGASGDAYIVNVDLLLWNTKTNSWLNCGPVEGPTGPAGPGNTLSVGSVMTTTGDAAVTITGVSPDQVLNMEIPRGLQGLKGDKGDQGEKGDRGDPGVPGVVKGTPPIHVDEFTDTVSLDETELNAILDGRYSPVAAQVAIVLNEGGFAFPINSVFAYQTDIAMVRVRKAQGVGLGNWSDPFDSGGGGKDAPPAPVVTSTGGTGNLAWSAVSGPAGTTLGYGAKSFPSGPTVTVSGLTATVAGVTAAGVYEFSVWGVNVAGKGKDGVLAITYSAPSAPTISSATPGSSQVVVNWTAPTTTGNRAISGYKVQYRKVGDTAWTLWRELGVVLTSTVTGLTGGQPYEFIVSAKNACGYGADSVKAQASPLSTPGPSTLSTATAGVGSANLTWAAPTDGSDPIVTGYVIQTKIGAGAWTDASTVGKVLTSVVLNLPVGTSVSFRVLANSAAGRGVESNVLSATPVDMPAIQRTWNSVGSFVIQNYDNKFTYSATATAGAATVNGSIVSLNNGNSTATITSSYSGVSKTAQVARRAYTNYYVETQGQHCDCNGGGCNTGCLGCGTFTKNGCMDSGGTYYDGYLACGTCGYYVGNDYRGEGWTWSGGGGGIPSQPDGNEWWRLP